MKYTHIISRLTGSHWCIRDHALQALLDTLTLRLNNPRADMGDAITMCDHLAALAEKQVHTHARTHTTTHACARA